MSVTATRFKTPPNTTDWSLSKYKSRSSEPCGAELHILSSDELTVEQGSAQMLAFSCCGRQRPGKDALLIARVSRWRNMGTLVYGVRGKLQLPQKRITPTDIFSPTPSTARLQGTDLIMKMNSGKVSTHLWSVTDTTSRGDYLSS